MAFRDLGASMEFSRINCVNAVYFEAYSLQHNGNAIYEKRIEILKPVRLDRFINQSWLLFVAV